MIDPDLLSEYIAGQRLAGAEFVTASMVASSLGWPIAWAREVLAYEARRPGGQLRVRLQGRCPRCGQFSEVQGHHPPGGVQHLCGACRHRGHIGPDQIYVDFVIAPTAA